MSKEEKKLEILALAETELKRLPLGEIRKFAAEFLRGKIESLRSAIVYVSEVGRSGGETSIGVAKSAYEIREKEMQGYGIWKEGYEDAYKKVLDMGRMDDSLFFGSSETTE